MGDVIDRAELSKLPYLDQEATGNRFVKVMPYWNGAYSGVTWAGIPEASGR